ncbi:histone deacetylase family protein [Halopenitus sp. H-Gu1]|uniref:histone deacetylase family protein n=1 Tax=Halopenitus sp. H-Gu1 TaxID=3242697 RepID=UPI00359D9572
MQFGYSDVCLEHDTGDRHPESPDRLRAIREGLKREHEVIYQEAPPADRSAIEAVHDEDYVDEIEAFCAEGGGNWDPDTVATEGTFDAALMSAGLARWAAIEALSGSNGRRTPFAIGRPPGHHAVEDDAMGFCFFNNAAVAAQAVIDEGRADRVLIFDWDVHHGNGTQDIFYDREDVFYASIHEQGLYPGTGEIEETGTGNGDGTTLNVPLSAGAGDEEYRHAIDETLAPLCERFDPDLLFVSAGFDAHRHDPISRMRVSTEGYGMLTDRVRSIANRVGADLGFVLEGGYGLDTLSDGVKTVHETFDGRAPIDAGGDVNDSTQVLVEDVRSQFDL